MNKVESFIFSLNKNKKRVHQIKENETPQHQDVCILATTPLEKLKPGKMVMINLPGNGTSLTDDAGHPKNEDEIKTNAENGRSDFFRFVNGLDFENCADENMKMRRKDAQTLACYYSRKVNAFVEEYNETGELHESLKPFADLFDDLISKDGQKISVEEAAQNMRNVVLRGHCFGTLVISELEQYLHEKLETLGYNEAECARILSAPTAIFSSSPVDIEKQPKYFKVVAYANCNDGFLPRLKGVPDYKAMAGFSQKDVDSEERKIKEIKLENKPNYRLIVCSSLEFPSLVELKEFIRDRHDNLTEKEIGQHIATIYRGHAFSAISDILKKSPFMKLLQKTVQEAMAEQVREVVLDHTLDEARQKVQEIKTQKFTSNRKRAKAILTAEKQLQHYEEMQLKQARRA